MPVIPKAPIHGTLKFGKEVKNPVYELQIRTRDLKNITLEVLQAIHSSIADGEVMGYNNNFMWEVVKKEDKNG